MRWLPIELETKILVTKYFSNPDVHASSKRQGQLTEVDSRQWIRS